ncbi:MAG: type II toxin-antitoxin system prevent-host-death family antitoxin [Wenzhouxiangella sp.]|nr:MAG: type II toxin-antitoxin system prevent-host-death family antitoxin [Wenzhouxiangella sp.]
MESITATKAARHFSDLLNRVAYRHETLEISRGGRAIARLIPIEPKAGVKLKDLNKLLANLPDLADDAAAFAEDVEAAEPAPEGDAWES